MLEIQFIREHADAVKANLRRRGDEEKVAWVDDVLQWDAQWRELKIECDKLRHERNVVSQKISEAVKAKQDASTLKERAKELPGRIAKCEEQLHRLQADIRGRLLRIPNMLHESVPVGKDDSENVEIKRWGKPVAANPELIAHAELVERLGLADFERARKVSGAGFVYLKDELAILDLALQRFAIDQLRKKGFTFVAPPLMMRRAAYEGVTDLASFEDVIYKVENEDEYMISTSEHPLGAMFMDEVIDELPLKLVGVSPCFRKEIGSSGVDTKGLFRMHQFNKVEQFVFCRPEDSWKIHEEIQRNSEELFEALGIPYRVVNICTGDMGIVAAKKFDIEAWFPREGKYREVTSASNCTSYQAVRLNVRYQAGEERRYVHTLNNTAIATSRAMRAILENFQQPDGSVLIPKVLQPYCGFEKIGA